MRNILIVTDRPGLYSVHHWGAVDFNYANKNHARIKSDFDRRALPRCFGPAADRLCKRRTQSKGRASLPILSMEVAFEAQFSATAKMRISRLRLNHTAVLQEALNKAGYRPSVTWSNDLADPIWMSSPLSVVHRVSSGLPMSEQVWHGPSSFYCAPCL